eukprot:UN06339
MCCNANTKLTKSSSRTSHKLLLFLLYLWFGCSCVWFVFGLGKQNIDYYIRKYVYYDQWNNMLIPYETLHQGAMSQANLYNLKYINDLNRFYGERSDTYKEKTGTDIVIKNFANSKNMETWTYFPSLVQHIGRASTSKLKNQEKRCAIKWLKQSLTFISSKFCSTDRQK